MARLDKQPKPLGVCSVCRALTNEKVYLNHRCSQTLHGRRCSGMFKSALTVLWDQCESCGATGKVGSQSCSGCLAFGWKMYG
jgi:hypothetical protein